MVVGGVGWSVVVMVGWSVAGLVVVGVGRVVVGRLAAGAEQLVGPVLIVILVFVIFVGQIVTRGQSCSSGQQLLYTPGLRGQLHHTNTVQSLVLHDSLLQLLSILVRGLVFLLVVLHTLSLQAAVGLDVVHCTGPVLGELLVLLVVGGVGQACWVVVVGGVLVVRQIVLVPIVARLVVSVAARDRFVVSVAGSDRLVVSVAASDRFVVSVAARDRFVVSVAGGGSRFVPVVLNESQACSSSQSSPSQLEAVTFTEPLLWR